MRAGIFLASLFCLFLIIYECPIFADQILTLHEALQRASQHNLSLDAAQKALGISKGAVSSAHAIPNPEFDVLFSQISTNDPQFSDSAKDFTIQQTLEVGGKRKLRTQSATAGLESEKSKLEALQLDVARDVKEAYWDLSLAYEQMNFTTENLKFQQRFLSRVQENFQVNKANLADLTRAKVEVASAANDVFETRKKLAVAESNLNRLMGEDVRKSLPTPERLGEKEISVDEDKLLERALVNRPEKKTIDHLREGGEADLKLAKTMLWAPDLKTQLLYQKGERNDGNDSWGAGLGLNLPIFNHFKGERLSAQAKLESLKSQLSDLDQQITLEVHQACQQLNLSGEQLKLWKEAVDQATESARLAEQRYLDGSVDLLVFFQARRDLEKTTLQYLDALRNYRVDQASLERAIGSDLT